MNEEDFRLLIDAVEARLIEAGAAELADETNYVSADENTGEERLLDPKHRLIAMLQAFDRYLAVRDNATYQNAMGRIRQNIREGSPERAMFVPVADAVESVGYDLSSAPDLSEVRLSLRRLEEQLREEPLESS